MLGHAAALHVADASASAPRGRRTAGLFGGGSAERIDASSTACPPGRPRMRSAGGGERRALVRRRHA